MPAKPRQLRPELESDVSRSPELGYEAPDGVGFIRCLEHGYPTPLARWHCHDEYELHLITATSGRAFVGDWIGPFQPGHVVLTGPRLPHNWISVDVPPGGVARRDLVIQFRHEPIAEAAQHMPEMRELMPLLDRARHGIEFFGMEQRGVKLWNQVRGTQGLARLATFCEFMHELQHCTDYRLLSSAQMQSLDSDAELDQIDAIVQRITDHLAQPPSAAELARELNMSDSRFSRFFRRATGNTFTDFVNHVRIARACQLLMESDRYIAQISYEVGFNNMANFNRRFLDFKGMTPTEYRRQVAKRFGAAAA